MIINLQKNIMKNKKLYRGLNNCDNENKLIKKVK